MLGLAMCLERSLAIIDFIEEEMVRIAREIEDVEPTAARLLGGCRAVLLDSRQKVIALGGHDIEINGVDEHPG